jgi:hypothetical protein
MLIAFLQMDALHGTYLIMLKGVLQSWLHFAISCFGV